MSTIFLFIKTLYLKQQTNILRCFSSLKLVYLAIRFFRCTFRSEMKVYTGENDEIAEVL